MENRGLVQRKMYAEVPVKVEYSLTDVGWQLQPVISEMWRWGDLYKDSLEQQNNKLT